MTPEEQATLGSKLDPHPLDAYQSAEPNEPVFTLQGGDPLAAPLVILWARLARARCGLGFEPQATIDWLSSVVARHQVEAGNKREDLLRRSTEAEMVCWAMEAFHKGHHAEPEDATQPTLVGLKLDLHDYRIYCANRISSAFSELNEMMDELDKLNPGDPVIESISNEIINLRTLFNEIEPRPGRKLDNVDEW